MGLRWLQPGSEGSVTNQMNHGGCCQHSNSRAKALLTSLPHHSRNDCPTHQPQSLGPGGSWCCCTLMPYGDRGVG